MAFNTTVNRHSLLTSGRAGGSLISTMINRHGLLIITMSPQKIDYSLTGVVAQLYATMSGTLTWSLKSGDSRVSISSSGAVSLSSGVGMNSSLSFVAQVHDILGETLQQQLTLSALPVTFIPGMMDFSNSNNSGLLSLVIQ